jgi:hypothetical protein
MLTLFTTPKPFRGHIDVIQRNALRSWKNLWPDVQIIIFGPEEGAAEVCAEFGLHHEPYVDTNKFGTKRIDWIFRRAQEIARHKYLCYSNCDIILLSDFARTAERLMQKHNRFLMVGRRWDTPITEPFTDFSPASEAVLRVLVGKMGVRQTDQAIDYFLFAKGLYEEMPPLVVGRIWWDHWLVWHARAVSADVVDVSSQVIAIHQNHDYGYHPEGAKGVWNDEQALANYDNAGGRRHLYTIDDATFILDDQGERRNLRRFYAPYWRFLRPSLIPVWHGLLNVTRPLRHKLGLKLGNSS